jgi:lipopolysaccharide export system permease protein
MILNCYLLKQLMLLFGLTVGLLSGVGVAIGTLSDLAYQINNYNLPLVIALKIFFLKIPEYVAYGLPIATLLTTLIVYGRLNSDREIIALKSIGISVKQIILPAIYFSTLITIITLIINEAIVPQANYQVTLLQQPFLPKTNFTESKKDIFYPEYELVGDREKQLKRLYFAEKFEQEKFKNIVVMSWSSQKDRSSLNTPLVANFDEFRGNSVFSRRSLSDSNFSQTWGRGAKIRDRLEQIITAKYAFWNERDDSWYLQQGTIDNLSNKTVETIRTNFKNYELKLPKTLFEIVTRERDPYAMNLTQAREYLRLILDSNNSKKIRLFQVRIQQKIAFPSICLIFAFIGSSLGATFSNLNRSRSFGFCIAIVFSYYVLGFTIGSLGIAGLVSPLIAAWLPNAIALGSGLWLLKRAN